MICLFFFFLESIIIEFDIAEKQNATIPGPDDRGGSGLIFF